MSEDRQPTEILNAKPHGFELTTIPRKPNAALITFRAYNNATEISANSSEPGHGEILIDSYIEITDPDYKQMQMTLHFETPVILT